jgi:hypothetical protein
VEQLLVSLILDNRIQGHVDQVRPAPCGRCVCSVCCVSACQCMDCSR